MLKASNALDRLRIRRMFLNILLLGLLSPFIALILTTLHLYRFIVKFLLKIQLRDKFSGLLDGTDCVWAVEDASSLSVINILAILEENAEENGCTNLLHELRSLVEDRLLNRNTKNYEKLACLRKRKYGYYYWQKCERVRIEDHIRWLEGEDKDKEDLRKGITKICNKPLPLGHEACWEILVWRNASRSESEDLRKVEEGRFFCDTKKLKGGVRTTPILFRVHHTLGDGVALLRLLLEELADANDSKIVIQGEVDDGTIINSRMVIPDEGDEGITKHARTAIEGEGDVGSKKHTEVVIQGENDAESMKSDDERRPIDDIYSEMMMQKKLVASKELKVTEEEGMTSGFFDNDNFKKHKAKDIISQNKELLSAAMPFSPIYTMQLVKMFLQNHAIVKTKVLQHTSLREVMKDYRASFWKKIRSFEVFLTTTVHEEFHRIARIISIVIVAPGFLLRQYLKSTDYSALHGPKLSGEKITSCWMEKLPENVYDSCLVTKIQEVKDATGATFSNVIMAALSSGLEKYFKQIGDYVPQTLTVVVPATMTAPGSNFRLENGFSVALFSLCIGGKNGEKSSNYSEDELTITERLFDVTASSEKLKRDPDYTVNFWLMKWLSGVLPEVLLRPFLNSRSTLIFSNLPGPREVKVLGRKLENIVFWTPQKGTTGIGYSVLSYGRRLHFGLVADRAIIPSAKTLQTILDDTVREIENLHDSIFLTPFSKSLHCDNAALTQTETESC